MLILPIKKKWYDMILSGEKKEEYREIKPYYRSRFVHLWQGSLLGFDAKRKVMFRNGYSKQSPSFIATVTLDIGTGKPEWGAEEGKNYYILKICDIEPTVESGVKMRDLKHVLESHEKWVNGVRGGERANLKGGYYPGEDLRGVNLSRAYLVRLNLREANLEYAHFERAEIDAADLRMTNLMHADLRLATLRGADLRQADLRWAALSHANLTGADLRGADLRGADLSRTILSKANLEGANLTAAFGLDLACPSDGEFTAWKKADGKLVKLLIPSDAKRSSSTSSRCRSDKAIVLGIYTLDGEETLETSVQSDYDPTFVYTVGETVYADSFDDNRFNSCSHGIHFFVDRSKASQY